MGFGYQVLGFGSGGAGTPPGIVANGGALTFDGDYAVNLFASSGTFTVVKLADDGVDDVEYVVVGGGGNGTNAASAGRGGAGGYRACLLYPSDAADE